MKRIITRLSATLALTFAATPALAHPGHDHTYVPGGEQHHLLWVLIPVAALAAWGIVRFARRRNER